MLRPLLLAFLSIAIAATSLAGRNTLKPSDFEPLTSLPWKKPDATLEGVLDAIFRETNPSIRYPVLREYLRLVPEDQLGKAFELCIDLEGTQTPDNLVGFFLRIWAQRDPQACWKRTRELFHVVGIEDHWLGYESWEQPRLTVQDRAAIGASRFWISRETLDGFLMGIAESSLSPEEQARQWKEYADLWFASFGSSTEYLEPGEFEPLDRHASLLSLMAGSEEQMPKESGAIQTLIGETDSEAVYEMGLRRLLIADPASAPQLMRQAEEKKWPPLSQREDFRRAGPSPELLMLWAKLDLPGMARWAEELDARKEEFLARKNVWRALVDQIDMKVRGFLMNRVDAATRERWLAAVEDDDDRQELLFEEWAAWDPKTALDLAAAIQNGNLILDAAVSAARGIGTGCCPNTRSYGLAVVRDFNAGSFPKEIQEGFTWSWESVMDYWGEVDIGETARHGLNFILRTNFAPRENMLKYYTGEDGFADDAVMDRTFCALRVWAMVRPQEMKAWIGWQRDPELQTALTWLLEHPEGGPEEK